MTTTALANIRKGFLDPADDLSKLHIIDAESVQALVKEINKKRTGEGDNKHLVVMLATGGTLSSALGRLAKSASSGSFCSNHLAGGLFAYARY